MITGFAASRIINQQGQGCILNVVLGIVGACVGGLIFTSIGGQGITDFNVHSMFIAIIGAIVVLLAYMRSPVGGGCLRRCRNGPEEHSVRP